MKTLGLHFQIIFVLFVLASCEGMDELFDGAVEPRLFVYTGDYSCTGLDGSIGDFTYEEVAGDLVVDGTDLKNISEFSTLTRVSGSVRITNNLNLKNINGLNNMTYIGGDIVVANNPEITYIDVESLVRRILQNGGVILGRVYHDGVEIVPATSGSNPHASL